MGLAHSGLRSAGSLSQPGPRSHRALRVSQAPNLVTAANGASELRKRSQTRASHRPGFRRGRAAPSFRRGARPGRRAGRPDTAEAGAAERFMTVVIIVVGIDDDLHDAMIVFMGIMMMTMIIATLRSREVHLRGFFGLLHGRLHAVADERSKGSDV